MLVYTQTSPALHELVREIEQAALMTGEGEKLRVSIDSRSGFTWPWAWYLRRFTNIAYTDYSRSDIKSLTTGARVVVVHRDNNFRAEIEMREAFTAPRRLPHRWWFPENEAYKGLTPGEFANAVRHPDQWDKFIDFFLYRKLPHPLGSEDAYVYFSKDLPLQPFE
jgi:hypothetical protein